MPPPPSCNFCSLVRFMAVVFSPVTLRSLLASCLVLSLLWRAKTSSIHVIFWGPVCSAKVTWGNSRACNGELTESQRCRLPLVTQLFIQLIVGPPLEIFRAAVTSSDAEVQRQIILLWFLWVWTPQSVVRWAVFRVLFSCWEVEGSQILSAVIMFWRSLWTWLRDRNGGITAALCWPDRNRQIQTFEGLSTIIVNAIYCS